MSRPVRVAALSVVVCFCAVALLANLAPVVDRFVADPPAALPGQIVTLTLDAHDPDCASSCTTGCGLTIRSDLLVWSDNTGRTTPSPFANAASTPAGSPFSATVQWTAPAAEGTYTVTAQVNDSGGMLCGGRKMTNATITIAVTNAQPPVIDSFTVTPASVAVGGAADLAVVAHDPSNRPLTYAFTADAGSVTGSGPTAKWIAPQSAGSVTLRVKVTAGASSVSAQTTATVQIGGYARMLTLDDTRATRIAVLPDGRIAVVDGASGTLQVVTTGGIRAWRKTGLSAPVAVAVSNNQLFVLERGASVVSVWDLAGNKLRTIAIAASLANGIAIGPNAGELAISDTSSAIVRVISAADGAPLRTIGDGVLAGPAGIATSNGRLAVADVGLGRVVLFDNSGNVIRQLGDDTLLTRPQGLAWDAINARLPVADAFSGEVIVIGEDNSIRGTLGGFGTAAGQLVNPIDVALFADGSVGVTTAGGNIPLFQLLNSLGPVRAPGNVLASDRLGDDGGAIALTWSVSPDDPSRVTAYLVQRALGEAGDFQTVARLASGTTQYADTTTIDGNCYHYQIAATDGVSTTASPQTPCATSINDAPPPAPLAAQAAPLSPTSIRVTWSAVSAPDLAGYVVDAGGISGSTTIDINNLSPATSYTFAVRAVDTAGNRSQPVTASAQTYPDAAPATPTNVAVVFGNAVADVTWSEPQSSVPVAMYAITLTPRTAGWPVISAESTTTNAHVASLVNRLDYDVTVIAKTSWDRASAPSSPVTASPAAPPLALPVVGESSASDVSGTTINISFTSPQREIRFQYRTGGGAKLQLLVDGKPAGAIFPDTIGSWSDGNLILDAPAHTLELRNESFPDPLAQFTVRRVDFVPLAPQNVTATGFNSVVDIARTWNEPRADLVVNLTRGTTRIACCRDAFLTNGVAVSYTIAIVSPAGWSSTTATAGATPQFTATPPPITDAHLTASGLDWTRVSSSLTDGAAPVAIPLYRIYRLDNGVATLLGETASPPFAVPPDATVIVRSVDALGRESQ